MARFILMILTLFSSSAFAHVKWFTRESFAKPPITFADLNTPTFWNLFVLSMFTLAFLVWLDRKLESWGTYRKMNDYFDQFTSRATLILRVFTGASILLSWQVDSMIAPELHLHSAGWGWYQFALALLLLFRVTTPVAGAGMVVLYIFAATQYGIYHLLDYVVYLAIGIFLFLSNSTDKRIKDLRIPVLYAGLGFSLCWVAMEKLFFPNWGLDVLQQQPALTMGLPPEFFLMACAFVEMSLGYLLIICLLQRPLALVITVVFFTTTAFFGKTEVVGHTLLHGALLVFVVIGQRGTYQPPIAFHKNLGLRMAFASVNFAILFALLAYPYHMLSQKAYEKHQHMMQEAHGHSEESHADGSH